MNVVLCAMFKNATGYIPRYNSIVRMFRDANHLSGNTLRLVFAEGDSQDNTWDHLHVMCQDLGVPHTIIKREHGKSWSGNPDWPVRWEALSFVSNSLLCEVTPDDDVVLYIESDLIWIPYTALRLIDHLDRVDAVSPGCYTAHGAFYDIWGFIRNGTCFNPFPPYHHEIEGHGLPQGDIVKIDASGSAWCMRGDVARRVRFGDGDWHSRGLGKSIYRNGYQLWYDPNLYVIHP